MGIGFKIRGPDAGPSDLTDITDYFRMYEAELTMNAEEGSVGTSTIRAYDENGTFDYAGHRAFQAYESSATGSNTVIYSGYTAEREYSRGDFERTGAGRVVDITLNDINTIFSRRVIVGADAVRPAETDVERVQWWESSAEGSLIDDTRYLSTANPVAMDAVDYSGQTGADVLNDCAQASGKNWFVWRAGDTDEYSLWYDFSSSENHSSPLRLTNVLTDIDSDWTFAISPDTKLKRDPSRVYSDIYLPYDGGAVFERDQDTQNEFARRGGVMPSYNVKSVAKATARAQRYLADLDTEEDVITTTVVLPAAKVNFLTAGMRVQFKATHLPGYEDWTWLRAVNRTVSQISEEFYSVQLDLASSISPASIPSDVVLEATLTIGTGTLIGGDTREFYASSDLGLAPVTLTPGKQYRLVASPVSGQDVGDGLQYSLGTTCSGLGRRYDVMNSPAISLVVTGTTTLIWETTGYDWAEDDTDTTFLDYTGPSWVFQGIAGDDFACGFPAFSPGGTYAGAWYTFNGPAVSADIAISGSAISGFFGFYWTVNVQLQERDP